MTKKKHGDRIYLQHILDSIDLIESFTAGILHIFNEAPENWHATLRMLQTLSESATHLSEETQALMPAIDWHRIRGFRNLLVHNYLGDIDPMIIRKVIEIELPKLQGEVTRVLAEGKE